MWNWHHVKEFEESSFYLITSLIHFEDLELAQKAYAGRKNCTDLHLVTLHCRLFILSNLKNTFHLMIITWVRLRPSSYLFRVIIFNWGSVAFCYRSIASNRFCLLNGDSFLDFISDFNPFLFWICFVKGSLFSKQSSQKLNSFFISLRCNQLVLCFPLLLLTSENLLEASSWNKFWMLSSCVSDSSRAFEQFGQSFYSAFLIWNRKGRHANPFGHVNFTVPVELCTCTV